MEEKLNELMSDAFGTTSNSVDRDEKLMNMASWDSLRHMEFILAIESEFDIQLDGDEIASMETLGRIQSTLERKLEER